MLMRMRVSPRSNFISRRSLSQAPLITWLFRVGNRQENPLISMICCIYYKSAPPLRGAVVRGARQHAPRRLMGGASSAFLEVRGARGGSCYCCSACAECSGLGCRTAAAALRVAGGAGCVTIRRLTISNTTANNMCNMYAGTLLAIIYVV